MSTQIDNKVVSMQFDNTNFEKNVAQSMSTLDKLKEKMNFKGFSDGLDKFNKQLKQTDFAQVQKSLDTVTVKFDKWSYVAAQQFDRMIQKAEQMSKRLVDALTIEPIKSGLEEYETQINAVQTILANTESKGSTLSDVKQSLGELNTYADKTIYNFTEMTKNIGTFTAAGVGLQDATKAIQGIANLAAVSGSTSQQASTAMYQLSQALSAGKVSLQDWNSVVNAGMGGEVFQRALVRTSEMMGTGAESAIKQYGTFRESLTKGQWLTKEVMTETLNELAGAYSKADLIAKGYTEKQANEILKLAQTATDAATKVKTFTQLVDTIKEAMQSGWTQSWEYILGDFEEAKKMYTNISDTLGKIIGESADRRNKVLHEGMATGWKQLLAMGVKNESAFEKISKKVAKKHGVSVKQIIEDSYDPKTEKYLYETFAETLKEGWMNYDILNESVNEYVKSLEKMSVAEREAAGYTTEEFKALEELQKTINSGGADVDELIDNLSRMSGRENVIQGFANIWTNVYNVVSNVKKAFDSVAPQLTGKGLYDLTERFKNWTEAMKFGDLTLNGIYYSAKTFFATVITGLKMAVIPAVAVGKIAISLIIGIVKVLFGLVGVVGKAISAVHKFVFETLHLNDALRKFKSFGSRTSSAFKDLLDTLKNLDKTGFATRLFDSVQNGLTEKLTNFLEKASGTIDKIANKLSKMNKESIHFQLIVDSFKALASGAKSYLSNWVAQLTKLPKIQNGLEAIKKVFKDLSKGDLNPFKYFAPILDSVVKRLESLDKITAKDVQAALVTMGTAIKNYIKMLAREMKTYAPMMKEAIVYILKEAINGIKDAIISGASKIDDFLMNSKERLISFVMNLLKTSKKVKSTLTTTFEDIKNGLADNYGSIAAIAIGIGTLFGLLQMAKLISKILTPFIKLGNIIGNIDEGLGGVFESVEKAFSSLSKSLNSLVILNLALSIFFMAKALTALAEIPIGALVKSVAAIAFLAVILAGLTWAIGQINIAAAELAKGIGQTAGGAWAPVLAIAGAILAIAVALKIIDSLNPENIANDIKVLIVIIGALAGMMVVLDFLEKDLNLGSLTLLAISFAVLSMAKALRRLQNLNMESFGETLFKFGTVVGALVILMIAVAKLNDGATKEGILTLLAIAVTIHMLASALKKLDRFEFKNGILKTIGELALIVFSILGILYVAGKASINSLGGAAIIIAFAVSMRLLIKALKAFSDMEPGAIIKGLIAMTLVVKILGQLMIGLAIAGPEAILASKTIQQLATAILIISVAMRIIAKLGVTEIGKALGAITALSMIFGSLIYMSGYANEIPNIKMTMITLAASLLVMSVALAALSFVKWDKLLPATIALGTIMLIFGEMIKATANIPEKGIATFIAMIVSIGLITAALFVLTKVPTDSLVPAAISLSIVIATLAGAMWVLGETKTIAMKALGPVAVMGLIIGELAVMIKVMAMLNPDGAITQAIAIAIVMTSLIGVLLAAAVAGDIAKSALGRITIMEFVMAGIVGIILLVLSIAAMNNAIQAAGAIATMLISLTVCVVLLSSVSQFARMALVAVTVIGMIMAGIILILKSMSKMNPKLMIARVVAISILLLALTGVVALLGLIGPMAPAALAGMGALAVFIVGFGGLMAGLGALSSKFPALKKFAEEGIPLLELIGRGLGSFAAGLVEGFATGFTGALKKVGKDLSDFMISVQGFIIGAKLVDTNALKGVINLTKMIKAIAGAEIVNAFANFITGGDTIKKFSEDIVPFGEGMAKFSKAVSGNIDGKAVEAAANAGRSLGEMAKALPKTDGLLQKFVGESGFTEFVSNLVPFGEGMANFSKAVSGKIDTTTVESAANAGKAIAEMASALPKEGGWMQTFTGTLNYESFDKGLTGFGKAIKKFATSVSGVSIEAIDVATNAGNKLAEMMNNMPSTDGWLQKIIGTKDIGTLGVNLKSFCTNLSGIDVEAVKTGASAIKSLSKMFKSLEGIDVDIFTKFDNALALVGTTGISSFASSVSDGTKIAKDSIENLMNAIIKKIKDKKGAVQKAFGDIGSTAGDSGASGAKKMAVAFGDSLANSLSANGGVVNSATKSLVTSAANSMSDATGSFDKSGKELTSSLIKGLKSGSKKVDSAGEALAKSGAKAAKARKGDWTESGRYVTEGFVNGIREKKQAAVEAATAVAKAAHDALKKYDKEGSPSKLYAQSGRWNVEGFINGFRDRVRNAEDVARELGDKTYEAFRESTDRINDILQNGQNGMVITPVIDTTGVKRGLDAIDSLFSGSSAYDLSTRAAKVQGSIAYRSNNDDIVRAIRDLDNATNTYNTYSVNGITYDDGSNITSAIETLTKAVLIAGRA